LLFLLFYKVLSVLSLEKPQRFYLAESDCSFYALLVNYFPHRHVGSAYIPLFIWKHIPWKTGHSTNQPTMKDYQLPTSPEFSSGSY
jgi:hypothetical protein